METVFQPIPLNIILYKMWKLLSIEYQGNLSEQLILTKQFYTPKIISNTYFNSSCDNQRMISHLVFLLYHMG